MLASFDLPDCYGAVKAKDLRLLEPLGGDTPVGRFLAKRGPGMHNVAYEVADVVVEQRS